MVAKKLAALLTLLLVLVGVTIPQAASAADKFSPKATPPANAYRGAQVSLDDSRMLSVWFDQDDNGSYLRSGILKSDGTWTGQTEVVTKSRNYNFMDPNKGSLAIGPDGTVAFVWSLMELPNQSNSNVGSSTLYVSYTQDGLDWSSPMAVMGPAPLGNSFMCMMERECGFRNPVVSFDRFGTIAIVATTGDYDSGYEIVATSTRDGANWASKVVLDSMPAHSFNVVQLETLPQGGFFAAWMAYTDNWYMRYSTMSGSILNYWKSKKVVGMYDSPGGMEFGQTDPTHLSAFIYTQTNNIPVLHQRIYDEVAGTWGTDAVLHTFPAGWPTNAIQFSLGKNWHSAVGIAAVGNGVQHGDAYLIELINSVPQVPKLVATTEAEQAMNVESVRVNDDDSVTMVISGLNAIPRVITAKAGVLTENLNIPVTGTTQIWAVEAVSSKNGNIFMLFGEQFGYEAMVYLGASAPVPTSTLRLTGTAVTGKQLTALVPTFSGVSGIGKTTIQWYSCTTAVATPQIAVPAGCLPIAKATAAKFKVTTKQKKKFIAVAVVNQNEIGTTTLFSVTSKKAK